MGGRSKSTLFLMEQLVVIGVFAISAAVCVWILAVSYLMTVDSVDTRNALLMAESAAESYKAFSGDKGRVAEILGDLSGGQISGNALVIHFDSQWQPLVGTDDLAFILRLEKTVVESSVQLADITVTRTTTGDELVNLTVGVRGAVQ